MKIVLICFILFMLVTVFMVCRILKVHIVYVIILLGVLILLIEYKLGTNVAFAKNNKKLYADIQFKHLDIVCFRSYSSYDLLEFIYFRCVNALMSSDVVFGHCGIIILIDDVPYLLECTEDEEHGLTHGTCLKLSLALDTICGFKGRVHVVQGNLHTFVTDVDMGGFTRHFLEKHDEIMYNGLLGTMNMVGSTCAATVTNVLQHLDLVHPGVLPFTIDSLFKKKHYTVPVEFFTPIEIIYETCQEEGHGQGHGQQ